MKIKVSLILLLTCSATIVLAEDAAKKRRQLRHRNPTRTYVISCKPENLEEAKRLVFRSLKRENRKTKDRLDSFGILVDGFKNGHPFRSPNPYQPIWWFRFGLKAKLIERARTELDKRTFLENTRDSDCLEGLRFWTQTVPVKQDQIKLQQIYFVSDGTASSDLVRVMEESGRPITLIRIKERRR